MNVIAQQLVAPLLATVVVSTPPLALARTGPPTPTTASRPTSGVTLELEVAAEIVESAALREWLDQECRRLLGELPDNARRRGTLRVVIGGDLYQYEVSVTASRDGALVGAPNAWRCECTNDQLMDRLRAEVPRMANALVDSTPPPAGTAEPQPPSPPRTSVEPVARRIGTGEIIGLAVAGVGVAGLVAGAALMGKGTTPRVDPGRFEVTVERDYARPGVPIFVAGVGAVATGLVVYLLQRADRVRRVSMTVLPTGIDGNRAAGFIVSGRFSRRGRM